MSPLTNIRVIDFTRHLPGPFTTALLADLGAEVLKIEPPDGDPTRWMPPMEGDASSLFTLLNSGKSSVVIDLKSEEGRSFARRLCQAGDVVVESYKPGVATRFGIDYEAVRQLNPRIIYCSLSGYGAQTERSGHDLNFVALAGLLDLQRDQTGRPILPAVQMADLGGALFATIAILAAIHQRAGSGLGRFIDLSLSDAARALLPMVDAAFTGEGSSRDRFKPALGFACYDVYETSDHKSIALAALEPQFWERFCRTIEHPELIPRQYDESAKEEVRSVVAAEIIRKSRDEWEEIFRPLEACVDPVLTVEESRQRFGPGFSQNPLRRVFGAPKNTTVDELGASFPRAAEIAGLSATEIRSLAGSDSFTPRKGLASLIRRAALRFRS